MLPVSLILGIMFGVFNFMFGLISYKGIAAIFLYAPGASIVCLIYNAYRLRRYHKMNGVYWKKRDCVFFEQNSIDGYYFKWVNLIGLFLRAGLVFASLLLVVVTYDLSTKAGINQGISSSLFQASCMFTAIIFYFVFHQRLSTQHFLGIFLSMACFGLMTLSKLQKGEKLNLYTLRETDIAKILVLGMVTTVCLSSLTFMTKYWQIRFKYDCL